MVFLDKNMMDEIYSHQTTMIMPSYDLTIEAYYHDKCKVSEKEHRDGILQIVKEVSEDQLFSDVTSPQRRAVEWLIEKDDLFICPHQHPRKIKQRYILAVFYMTTGGSSWMKCYEGHEDCKYSAVSRKDDDDAIISITSGDKAYLSPVDECEWAGTTCDHIAYINNVSLSGILNLRQSFVNNYITRYKSISK